MAGVTPAPESAMSTVVVDPLTVIDRMLLAAPTAVGAKTTANVVLWFGASVSGRVRPVSLKPEPLKVACKIVRFVAPEFFRVSVCVWLVFTCTLPKVKLVGLAVKLPATTAVPVSAMFNRLFEPSLVTARLPVALPADCGLKTTLKLMLCPGDNVTGRLNPAVLKPAPVTATCKIVSVFPPVLLKISD